MSAIVVDGQLVHYEVLGRGRPVILLHGMIGSWRYWVPVLQRLQQSYRLYALDLFGFGDSAHSIDHFPLDRQIELVRSFMEEMGLPKAALIGHGLGALVAAGFARLHPDQAARLLLVSLPLFDTGDLEKRVPPPALVAAPARPAAPPAPPKPAGVPLPAVGAGASAAMRAALAEAARARRPGAEEVRPAPAPVVTAEPPKPAPLATPASPAPASGPRRNDLAPIVTQPLETLLARSYRRSDEMFAKLMVDVAKANPRAPLLMASDYEAGALLDLLRLLPMPTVAVHGNDDPIFAPPPEEVWSYLTTDVDRVFLPILLPGVRHFPMLEDERFYQITSDFLELADITRIELRERWRRRTR